MIETSISAPPTAGVPIARLCGVDVAYGHYQVIWGADLDVHPGEIVAVLGPNGAGKSTVLKALSGIVAVKRGSIELAGHRIEKLPTNKRIQLGLAHVLERRRVFPRLTVRENLIMGSLFGDAKAKRQETLEWVESLFPILKAREKQHCGRLSGGEQQMVAIARGLMSRPRILLVDEPTLGLAPRVAAEVFDVLRRLATEDDIGVVIVEQNVQDTLDLAERAYVLESGRVAISGSSEELSGSAALHRIFVGSPGRSNG